VVADGWIVREKDISSSLLYQCIHVMIDDDCMMIRTHARRRNEIFEKRNYT
jgi:hypothetical protein